MFQITSIFYNIGRVTGIIMSFIFRTPNSFLFFHSSSIGGAEKVHIDILEALNSQKIITVITENRSEKGWESTFQKFSYKCYDISNSNRNRKIFFFFLGYFSSWINNSKSILVLGSASYFYYRLLPFLKVKNRINLLHALVNEGEIGFEHLSLNVINHIDKHVLINEKVKNDFQDFLKKNNLDLPESKFIVIDNGVRDFEEPSLNTENEVLHCLFVGRESKEKRVHILESIIKKCEQEKLPIHFTLIGSDFETISNQNFSNTLILGKIIDRNELNTIYRKSDCLIICSSREGFPNVIQEAMAFGVVPISTDVGGIPYHIKHKKNGILISKNLSETEIANEMITNLLVFQNNIGELNRIKNKSFQYALNYFSMSLFVKKYQELVKL